MLKNQFKLNADAIELTFHNITQYLQDNNWWDSEKKRLKAIKVYKKLKLKKLFKLAKKDFKKYSSKVQTSLNKWCKECINNTQWKTLRESILQAGTQLKSQLKTLEKSPAQTAIANIGKETNISLSNTAYELLQKAAAHEKKSISALIIATFKNKKITADQKPESGVKIIEAIKNTQPDKKELKSHEKSRTGNPNTIEIWHYAGGQCQALSKVTQKRCKRITPDLSHKHQIIDKIDYEYAVCHTHDNNKSQLDQSAINIKS